MFDEKALADLPSLLTNELDMEETIRIQITRKRQTPSIKMSKYGVPQTRPVKHKELVDYEDTEISIQMRDNLKLINKRIASKWIDLELSLEEDKSQEKKNDMNNENEVDGKDSNQTKKE